MMRRQVAAVAAAFAGKNGADSVTKIDAGEIEPQNLIAEIVNINMFAPQRLIVVSGFENAKAAWEKIGENLARVPDEVDLIIATTKPDKRTKTFKDLIKVAKTREFPKLQGRSLQKWAADEAAEHKIKINPDAIDELISATSGDGDPQARLASEIAKLGTLNRPVDIELVRQIVEPNLATNAFEILDLAIAGQRRKVAEELKLLRESGEDANKFFGLLASQVFALAAAMLAGSDSEIACDLKIHPFQLSKARDLARQLASKSEQKRRVKKITHVLADTDAKIKLARADEAWTLIEVALAKL